MANMRTIDVILSPRSWKPTSDERGFNFSQLMVVDKGSGVLPQVDYLLRKQGYVHSISGGNVYYTGGRENTVKVEGDRILRFTKEVPLNLVEKIRAIVLQGNCEALRIKSSEMERAFLMLTRASQGVF